MRNRTPFVALVSSLCLGACALVGVARAQGGPGAGAPPPAGTATLQRPVDLDAAEMVKRGEATVARIDLSGRAVRKQLEAARQSRDVVKTLCLSDRLTQLDVTLRSARERKAALDAAAQRKDKELASHEITIIGVYRERSDRLVAEANQCVGSEVGMIGVTKTSLGVDPTIPDEEGGPAPRVVPFPGGSLVPVLVPEPGPCESCAFLCMDS